MDLWFSSGKCFIVVEHFCIAAKSSRHQLKQVTTWQENGEKTLKFSFLCFFRNFFRMQGRKKSVKRGRSFQLPRVIICESVQLASFVIAVTRRSRSWWQTPPPPGPCCTVLQIVISLSELRALVMEEVTLFRNKSIKEFYTSSRWYGSKLFKKHLSYK